LEVKPSSVEVRIEELVLHGLPPLDRHAVGDAVERELAARIAEQGSFNPPSAGRADAGDFAAPAGLDVDALGSRVADHVGRALG
jgi:hypothetical protein